MGHSWVEWDSYPEHENTILVSPEMEAEVQR